MSLDWPVIQTAAFVFFNNEAFLVLVQRNILHVGYRTVDEVNFMAA